MNSPAYDIAAMLDGDSALGLTLATDLFIGEIPGTVSGRCVAVYDSGGEPAQSGYKYERPYVQVRVRGAKGGNQSAFSLAESIATFLHDTANYTINAARYVGIWKLDEPGFVGWDDNRRPLYTVNFRIHRTDA